MLLRSDFDRVWGELCILHGKVNQPPLRADFFYKCLKGKGVEHETLSLAAQRLSERSRFFPSLAELLKACDEVKPATAYVCPVLAWERIRDEVFWQMAKERGTRRFPEKEVYLRVLPLFQAKHPLLRVPASALEGVY
jgi:hypothetical protein